VLAYEKIPRIINGTTIVREYYLKVDIGVYTIKRYPYPAIVINNIMEIYRCRVSIAFIETGNQISERRITKCRK
jgi:hypothetical protein